MTTTLKPQHEVFCLSFVKTGNARKAYMEAYTNVTSEAAARVNASKLLARPDVSARIGELMTEGNTEAKATADEVVTFLTDVMRGDADKLEGIVTMQQRIRAAELLAKRHGLLNTPPTQVAEGQLRLDQILGEVRSEESVADTLLSRQLKLNLRQEYESEVEARPCQTEFILPDNGRNANAKVEADGKIHIRSHFLSEEQTPEYNARREAWVEERYTKLTSHTDYDPFRGK